jgi:DNA polymerase-4
MRQRYVLHTHFHLAGSDPGLHAQLVSLLQDITPHVQALPPDSADLDITGATAYFERGPRGLGDLARIRTLAWFGVHTTVGAAPNRMLAAMAAAATPRGSITVVGSDPASVRAFLRPRPSAGLWGVGPATARALARHGLHTIGDVADTPLLTLQRLLGAAAGRALHEHSHGRDDRPVVAEPVARSLRAEHRFPRDEIDPAQHRCALLALADRLGTRMRTEQTAAGRLVLTVRYADDSATTRSRTISEPTSHTTPLTHHAYALYEFLALQRARVRSIALRAEALRPVEHAHRQLSLDPTAEKQLLLEAAADRVRARFGESALMPAALASPSA